MEKLQVSPRSHLLKIVVAGCLAALLPRFAAANMASPLRQGTATGLPLVSSHIRVQHELLKVTPSADFKTCNFDVTYTLVADSNGISVPMLFVAENYSDGMQVWVDGRSVEVQKLPYEYHYRELSPRSRFTNGQDSTEISAVTVEWEPGRSSTYSQQDLHFFIADLSAGGHQIRVTYAAEVWRDLSNLVAKEKFLYALEPASHWHAFGALDIELDLSQSPYPAVTNLGMDGKQDGTGILHWHFDALPAVATLEISGEPKLSGWAQFMMGIGQAGFFWISGILAAFVHAWLMWRHRRKHTSHWFSWVFAVGSLLVALVPLFCFVMSAEWINDAIGPAASRRGDYSFLIVFFYPLVLLVYAAIARLIDHLFLRARRRAAGAAK